MTSVRSRAFCRLSPNEEAHLRHLQSDERRKARLVQVRDQEKRLARQLRDRVKSKRETERRVLNEHVDAALADAHETELRELEEKYLSRVGSVGQGHRDAQHINEEENRLQELRLLLEAKQRWRAQDRHAAAMKELTASQLKEKQLREHSLHSRQQALEAEKKRAKQVAAANPSPSQMIIMDFELGRGRHVQFKEAEGYSSTYYHIPNPVVQRMGTPDTTEPSAREMAQLQMEEDQIIEKSVAALLQEQNEKARLRYKHAIAKVKLEKEKDEMLTQLETLEREDRASRQKSLAKMPTNLFQPAHRRIEMASEQQRDMEGAFERLFVRTQSNPVQQKLPDISSQVSPAPDSSLPTEQTDLSDQIDNLSPLSGQNTESNNLQSSPKATPDSGVHVDITTSSNDSGNTDTAASTQTKSPPQGLTRTRPVVSFEPTQQVTTCTQHSLPRDSVYTCSSSSSDESREHHIRSQPFPASSSQPHPSRPRPAWPTSMRSQDTSSSTDSHVSTRAMFTQTSKPDLERYLVQPTPLPDLPELTVTDVTSSDDQSTVGERSAGRRAKQRVGSDRTPMTTQTRKSEGMKTLLSMIQSQHQAWNDRLRKRGDLLQSSLDSSPEGVTVGVSDGRAVEHHPDSLSIYTLSTRESTLSPETSNDKEQVRSRHQPDQQSPLSSHSDSSYTPDQLSISPYQTTLETSTLQTAPSTPNHTSLPTVASNLPKIKTDTNFLPGFVRSGPSHAQSHPLAQHTLRHELPARVTMQSTSAPTVSSIGPIRTSPFQTAPVLTVSSHTSSTVDSAYKMTVPVSITSTSASTREESRLVQSEVSSNRPLFSVTQPTDCSSTHVSFQSPPEQTQTHLPLPILGYSAGTLDSHVRMPNPSSSAYNRSTLPLGQLSTQPTSEATHTTISMEDTGQTRQSASPDFQQPYDTGVNASQEGYPPTSETNHQNPDQLSILTFETSFSEPPDQATTVSEIDSTSLHQSVQSQPTSELKSTVSHDHDPSSMLTTSIGSSIEHQPIGIGKDVYLLDTIEESDAEYEQPEQDVTNSDSFRGERLQDDPPLSINDMDNSDFSLQPIEEIETEPVKNVVDDSPQVLAIKPDNSVLHPSSTPSKTSSDLQNEFIQSMTTPSPSVDSGLSLQEAFLKRKRNFVKNSQHRLDQIKASLEEQRAQQAATLKLTSSLTHSTPIASQHTKAFKSTSSAPYTAPRNQKASSRSRCDSGIGTGPGASKKRAVTFSSPLLQPQEGTGTFSPHSSQRGPTQSPDRLSSKDREKIKKREMRERNERFYQKLPEVRRKMEEEKRKQVYSANRDKAKHYEQKIRSKLKNKKEVKKNQQTTPAVHVTSPKVKSKPPFK